MENHRTISVDGSSGGKVNNCIFFAGITVNSYGGGFFTKDKDSFQRVVTQLNMVMDSFCGKGSIVNIGGEYPIDDPYISSDYGKRGSKMHYGVDLVNKQPGAVKGKPVYSVTKGIVVRLVTFPDGNRAGVRVRIQAPNGYQYNYFHLQDGSNDHLYLNKEIRSGDVIGTVGNTGASRGDHLHFEIWDASGAKVNPYDIYPNLNNIPHRK